MYVYAGPIRSKNLIFKEDLILKIMNFIIFWFFTYFFGFLCEFVCFFWNFIIFWIFRNSIIILTRNLPTYPIIIRHTYDNTFYDIQVFTVCRNIGIRSWNLILKYSKTFFSIIFIDFYTVINTREFYNDKWKTIPNVGI